MGLIGVELHELLPIIRATESQVGPWGIFFCPPVANATTTMTFSTEEVDGMDSWYLCAASAAPLAIGAQAGLLRPQGVCGALWAAPQPPAFPSFPCRE